jgi:hypothetical protein
LRKKSSQIKKNPALDKKTRIKLGNANSSMDVLKNANIPTAEANPSSIDTAHTKKRRVCMFSLLKLLTSILSNAGQPVKKWPILIDQVEN